VPVKPRYLPYFEPSLIEREVGDFPKKMGLFLGEPFPPGSSLRNHLKMKRHRGGGVLPIKLGKGLSRPLKGVEQARGIRVAGASDGSVPLLAR